jgi:type II secretory pathway component PulF
MRPWFVDVGLILFLVFLLVRLRWHADLHIAAMALRLLKFCAWLVFFAALLAGMVVLGGVLGFLLWLATLIIAMMIASRYRETERRMLLWSLGLAAEKGIPLPAAARAFADERHDGIGQRARYLAEGLEQGMPLDAALRASGTPLPPDALMAVRIGCETGRLGACLKGAARAAAQIETTARGAASQVIYLTILVCFCCGVIGFIQYKIVPELVKICYSHNMRLPAVSVFVINGCNWLSSPFLLFGIPLLLVTLLFALGRYVGLIRWDPPLVRRLTRRLDEAVVLRSLGQAVEQQQALPAAVASLAKLYPKSYVRARLRQARDLMRGGTDWCDSLQAAGLLGSVEALVLKSAERVDNLGWALGEMADRQVRRFTVRITTLNAIGFPVALLAIASVVFAIALSVFLPLVELIGNLS